MKRHHKILLSGTFDPFHDGHKTIVDTLLYQTSSVIVISPTHSKWDRSDGDWEKSDTLLTFDERIEQLERVYSDNDRVQVVAYEKDKPLSMFQLLQNSGIKSIAMGTDNVEKIPSWKNFDLYDDVLNNIFLFPRNVFQIPDELHQFLVFVSNENLPQISSTEIREDLKGDGPNWFNISNRVPHQVYDYLVEKFDIPKKLWVDDKRTPPHDQYIWAKTYKEAISHLQENKFAEVSLDHDLGDFDDEGNEKTGYDILMKIVESLHTDGNIYIPDDVRVHSANVVGHKRMQGVIDKHLKEK